MTFRKEHPVTTKSNMSGSMRDMVALSHLGYELLTVILVCFGIGYGIDYISNSSPIFCVFFSILGIVTGLYLVIRSAEMKSNKEKQEHEL